MSNKQRITLISFLAYFIMSGMLAPIGIVVGPMAELFDQPVTTVAAQFSWLTFGILIGAIAALFVFDFFKLKVLMIVLYTCIGASLIFLDMANDLNKIGYALGVIGVCCGVGLAAAALVISTTYSAERRASMLVITDASFSTAGFSIAALATTLVAAGVHWAGAYRVVAIVCGIVLVLSLVSRFPQTPTVPKNDERERLWPLGVWLCLAALFLYTLGQYSMLWWLPNYAETRLGATVDQAGQLVTLFWVGLFASQLLVAWLVIKIGVKRLVFISATMTCLFSIPLWTYGNLSALPVFAFFWGLANFGLLKVVLSFATELVAIPTPRLVSTLLLGATLGTAVSPWVTSRIVVATDNFFILQFSTICYALLSVLLFLAARMQRFKPEFSAETR